VTFSKFGRRLTLSRASDYSPLISLSTLQYVTIWRTSFHLFHFVRRMISTLMKLSRMEVPGEPQPLALKICLGKAVRLPGERESDHFALKHLLLFSLTLTNFHLLLFFCFCCPGQSSVFQIPRQSLIWFHFVSSPLSIDWKDIQAPVQAFEGIGVRFSALCTNNQGTFNLHLNDREFMYHTFQVNWINANVF